MQETTINVERISDQIYLLRTFFISLYTYYFFIKMINQKKFSIYGNMLVTICLFLISLLSTIVKNKIDSISSIVLMMTIMSSVYSFITKIKYTYSINLYIISLSINYILFFFAVVIAYVPNIIFNIKNDYINLIVICITHLLLLYKVIKLKKLKNGIIFLQNNSNNDFFNIIMINISVSLVTLFVWFSNMNLLLSRNIFFSFIIFSIIMFITIQKSLQLYYKQRLLEQELKETKEELEKKKKEVEVLEKENLSFSKKSHSLAHKQKSLEYKLNQILLNSEIADDYKIQDRVKEISEELYGEKIAIELTKTDITQIDDMLKYMQSECIKSKIDFELNIQGNIYYMINNIISVQDLEILLADHIKNAIIAINHSDNINRSILVKLGKVEGIYSIYIYDSGIEFEKETLSNLGKKPSTTHKESGGTGMGFMNTFDTLNKYKASLIINEYNKPNKENYTKSIVIKFDKLNEFNICSYKNKNK